MLPILLCWPTTSEANFDGMTVEVEPSCQYSVKSCCHVTDGSRGQNGIWHGSDMKPSCVTEFLKVECGKNWTHWYSLTLAECWWTVRVQKVDESRVKQWVVHFSSDDSSVEDKLHSKQPCTDVTLQNEASQSAHPHELVDDKLGTVYRAEYWLQCIGNGGSVGISQILSQVDPTNAHTGTEWTLHASLSGPIESIWDWRWQFPGLYH